MSSKISKKKDKKQPLSRTIIPVVIIAVFIVVIMGMLFFIVKDWDSTEKKDLKTSSGNLAVVDEDPAKAVADKYISNYYDGEVIVDCIAYDENHQENVDTLLNSYKENEQYVEDFDFNYEYVDSYDMNDTLFLSFYQSYGEDMYIDSMDDVTEMKCFQYTITISSDKYNMEETTNTVYLYLANYKGEWKVLVELAGEATTSYGKDVTEYTSMYVQEVTDAYLDAEYNSFDYETMMNYIACEDDRKDDLRSALKDYEDSVKSSADENSLKITYELSNVRELTEDEATEFWSDYGSRVYISDQSKCQGLIRVSYAMTAGIEGDDSSTDTYTSYLYVGYIDDQWQILVEK